MTHVIDAEATDDGIRFTRHFRVPVDAVFGAWTTAADFSVWFGGPDVEVPLDRLTWEPAAGDDWSATMVLPDGTEIPWAGTVHEVDPPTHLVYDLTDHTGDERDLVTVDLEVADGGSLLRFSQLGGHMPAEQYEQAMHGWLAFMDAMADVIDGRATAG